MTQQLFPERWYKAIKTQQENFQSILFGNFCFLCEIKWISTKSIIILHFHMYVWNAFYWNL